MKSIEPGPEIVKHSMMEKISFTISVLETQKSTSFNILLDCLNLFC